MKLDRNITTPRRGKYALIKLRVDQPVHANGMAMVNSDAVDYGDTSDTDFFVIRLKDRYAAPALRAYANAARNDDREYAKEIDLLADRADCHPNQRQPD